MSTKEFIKMTKNRKMKVILVCLKGNQLLGDSQGAVGSIEVPCDSIRDESTGNMPTYVFESKDGVYIQLFQKCGSIKTIIYNERLEYEMNFCQLKARVWFVD